MKCPNCQSANTDTAKFCIECGHPLHAGHGAKAGDAAPAGAGEQGGAARRARHGAAPKDREDAAAASPAEVIGASLDEVRALREDACEVSADAEVFARLIADNARRSAQDEDVPRYGERRRGAGEPAPADAPAHVPAHASGPQAGEPAPADAPAHVPAHASGPQAGAPGAGAPAADAADAELEFEFVEELPVGGAEAVPDAAAPAEPSAPDAAADDDYGAFDEALYAPRDDDAPAGRDSLAEVVHEMFPDGVVSVGAAGAERTADLTGLERLVDSSYVPPAYAARAGDTMELPTVGEGPAAAAKRYAAEMDPKEARRARRAQRRLDRQMAREQRRGAGDGAPRPHRSRKPLVAAAVVVAAALIVAGVTWYLQLWGGKVVPDVVGRSQVDATYVLEDRGFAVQALPVKSDDVEGIVLLTDPGSGRRAEEGSTVVIHVSVARTVPDVVGLPQADAEAALAGEGLTSVALVEVKSNEEPGTVLSVTPEAGTKVKAATPLTVEVAVPYTVPEVEGLSQADATAALEAEGYEVRVARTYTEDVPEGTTVSTDPAAGTQLDSGSEVTLNVAKSRKAECLSYAQAYFQSSKYFVIGGKSYEIDPAKLTVDYVGDDTTRYSVSGIQYGSLFGIVVRDEATGWQTLTGTITWDGEGNVKASDPAIKRA